MRLERATLLWSEIKVHELPGASAQNPVNSVKLFKK